MGAGGPVGDLVGRQVRLQVADHGVVVADHRHDVAGVHGRHLLVVVRGGGGRRRQPEAVDGGVVIEDLLERLAVGAFEEHRAAGIVEHLAAERGEHAHRELGEVTHGVADAVLAVLDEDALGDVAQLAPGGGCLGDVGGVEEVERRVGVVPQATEATVDRAERLDGPVEELGLGALGEVVGQVGEEARGLPLGVPGVVDPDRVDVALGERLGDGDLRAGSDHLLEAVLGVAQVEAVDDALEGDLALDAGVAARGPLRHEVANGDLLAALRERHAAPRQWREKQGGQGQYQGRTSHAGVPPEGACRVGWAAVGAGVPPRRSRQARAWLSVATVWPATKSHGRVI